MRYRLAILYAVEGDLRFISHHDSMRLFRRALARAGLPVRYSEGFNPHPRLTIALPRPVGVASSAELLVVGLTSEVAPSDAMARLAPQLPVGITLMSAEVLADGDRRLPCEARYTLIVEPELAPTVSVAIEKFLASDTVLVERTIKKTAYKKTVDIRQYVLAIEINDDRLTWTQSITLTGTARLNELLDALGLPSRDHLHRLHRQVVRYDS